MRQFPFFLDKLPLTQAHRLLIVTHNLGGGVERYVADLQSLMSMVVESEILRSFDASTISLEVAGENPVYWHFGDWEQLVAALRQRGYNWISFQHIHGFPPQILELAKALGLPYDLTLHDFYPFCPIYSLSTASGKYCGEPNLGGCAKCTRARPNAWHWSISHWRSEMKQLLGGAVRITAPSRFVADRIHSHFPDVQAIVWPHPPRLEWITSVQPSKKILLIGKLTRMKGLDALLACARWSQDNKLGLTFCVLGFTESVISAAQQLPIQVRGEYADAELPQLLALERADVIWFPGPYPETYAYTLDVALASGLPIVASNFGAIAERLHGRPGALLVALDAKPQTWCEALLAASNLSPQAETERDEKFALQQRETYRNQFIAPILSQPATASTPPDIDQTPAEIDLLSGAPSHDDLPVSRLFEQGVECGHLESRLALKARLVDIERDYAVLAGYSKRFGVPWFELLDRVQVQTDQLSMRDLENRRLSKNLSELQSETDSVRNENNAVREEASVLRYANNVLKNEADVVRNENNALREEANVLRYANNVLKNEADAVRNENNALREEANVLRHANNVLKNEADVVRNESNALRDEIDVLRSEATDLRYDGDMQRQRMETLAWHIEDLDSQLRNAAQEMQANAADRIRAMARINELEASTSWRVTTPIRVVGQIVKKIRHKLQRYSALFRHGATRLPLAWKILRSDGPQALIHRMQAKLGSQKFVPSSEASTPIAPIGNLVLASCKPDKLPRISIVIPVYGHDEHTFNCLSSMAEHTRLDDVEIIVVDDASPVPVVQALGGVSGVNFIRAKQNGGFIQSCNLGAETARGEYLVLLNNDIQVTPGWLDSLLKVFWLHSDAGLVGARLVYPDGRLQEAGGIVWQDGSAWNWGRGDDPDRPPYRYMRAVDYCSGACLAIRMSDWRYLGGFDKAYAPAYYEDTDLAFRVRQLGKKVYYQPDTTIIHFEGISSGTDESSGVKRHQAINRAAFLERWRAVLKSHRPNAHQPQREADREAKARVLIVEACMITPDQDSGSVRMLAMLELLVELGCKVSFIADNIEFRQPYVGQLQQTGVEVWHHPFVDSVAQLLSDHGKDFDVIMFCRHYIAVRYLADVRTWAPKAKIVFDTVDLHYLREQRLAELDGSKSLRDSAQVTRQQELGVISSSDLTLVVSPVEQDLLAEELPSANVKILSNIHELHPPGRGFAERTGLIFVGGFRHPPNVDAVTWFVGEVWPLVQARLSSMTLTVVGSNMPPSIRELSAPNVHVVGFVEDIDPLLDAARISVAPLRYGAGVKGKINQAMACGLPVVATSVAAEGMNLQGGEDLLTADSPQAFADAVLRLYNDEDLWNHLVAGGKRSIEANFSRTRAKHTLAALVGIEEAELPPSILQ